DSAPTSISTLSLHDALPICLETRHHRPRDASPEQFFDACQQDLFLSANQGDCFAFLPRAAGAADTVHVILRNLRELEVHNVRQRSEEHTSELQSRENLVCRL